MADYKQLPKYGFAFEDFPMSFSLKPSERLDASICTLTVGLANPGVSVQETIAAAKDGGGVGTELPQSQVL